MLEDIEARTGNTARSGRGRLSPPVERTSSPSPSPPSAEAPIWGRAFYRMRPGCR